MPANLWLIAPWWSLAVRAAAWPPEAVSQGVTSCGFVAVELHRLGFDAVGIVADAFLVVGDAALAEEPIGDGVAPDLGVAGLVGEVGEHLVVAGFVDAAVERFPVANEPVGVAGAVVVRIVDVLNQRFAGVELRGCRARGA